MTAARSRGEAAAPVPLADDGRRYRLVGPTDRDTTIVHGSAALAARIAAANDAPGVLAWRQLDPAATDDSDDTDGW